MKTNICMNKYEKNISKSIKTVKSIIMKLTIFGQRIFIISTKENDDSHF